MGESAKVTVVFTGACGRILRYCLAREDNVVPVETRDQRPHQPPPHSSIQWSRLVGFTAPNQGPSTQPQPDRGEGATLRAQASAWRVSFTDKARIRHSVRVRAEDLYAAAE